MIVVNADHFYVECAYYLYMSGLEKRGSLNRGRYIERR